MVVVPFTIVVSRAEVARDTISSGRCVLGMKEEGNERWQECGTLSRRSAKSVVLVVVIHERLPEFAEEGGCCWWISAGGR